MMPSPTFQIVQVASTAVDAGIAAFAVSWAPVLQAYPWLSAHVGVGRIIRAVFVVSLAFVIKLPLLFALGLRPFGLMNIIYLDLVFVPAAAGLAVLLLPSVRKRATWPVLIMAAATLGCPAIGYYATFVEPFRLQYEETTVSLEPARSGSQPLRIGVLADLQMERVLDHHRDAVESLLVRKPDIIVLPGDYFQGRPNTFEQEFAALHELASRLQAPGGVYFAPGDVDHGPVFERIFAGTNVRPLVNETIEVTVGDRNVTIAGVELDYTSTDARRTMRELESKRGDDDVRILIAHRPDALYELGGDSRVDLVIAGHTHGGQVQLPVIGPLITLSDVPRSAGGGGLHVLEGRRLYVSRGVGWENANAPRIRFLCPPEVAMLTLEGGGGHSRLPVIGEGNTGHAGNLLARTPLDQF